MHSQAEIRVLAITGKKTLMHEFRKRKHTPTVGNKGVGNCRIKMTASPKSYGTDRLNPPDSGYLNNVRQKAARGVLNLFFVSGRICFY